MRLYYVGESENPNCHVLSALGVDAERWNDLFADMQDWRSELRGRYGIPPNSDLNARDPGTRTGQALLVEGGMPAINGSTNERLTRRKRAAVLTSGLGRIENVAAGKGGVEVINVCLPKQAFKDYERVSLDRMLNRVNASVKAANRHAFLIFDEGKEAMITRVYRRLRVFNPCAQQVRAVGGGGEDPKHPLRERHRWPRLPKYRRRLPAADGRPDRLRPAHARGGTIPLCRGHGSSGSLLDPGLRPQQEGVAPRSPGNRQRVKQKRESRQM